MKNVFIGTLMIMLMAATSNAALKGYWPLDGNTNDTSGNGNNGTLVGDPQFVDGIDGQAILFDGEDDGVTIDNEPFFDFVAPMTVSFWAKVPYGARPTGVVVGKQDYTIDSNFGGAYPDYKGVGWAMVTEQLRWEGDIMFHGYDTRGWPNERTPDYFNTNNDGKWHHYAAVTTATTITLYVDGQAQSGDARGGALDFHMFNDTPLTFGHTASYPGLKNWAGYLDDVQIYDTALTSTDIQNIYNASTDAGCGVEGDINGDCDVDLNDYVLLAQDWLK